MDIHFKCIVLVAYVLELRRFLARIQIRKNVFIVSTKRQNVFTFFRVHLFYSRAEASLMQTVARIHTDVCIPSVGIGCIEGRQLCVSICACV